MQSIKRWWAPAALICIAGLGITACGVGESSSERAAAPVDEDAPNDQVGEETTSLDAAGPEEMQEGSDDQEPVQAGLLGARVCVINERSTKEGRLPRINVQFTKADRESNDSGLVAPGDQHCGEAAYSSEPQDVSGVVSIMYEDAPVMYFNSYNTWLGNPAVELVKAPNSMSACAASRTEGGKSVFDNGFIRYTTKRLPDSTRFKEFTISVSDSQGAVGQCTFPAGPKAR